MTSYDNWKTDLLSRCDRHGIKHTHRQEKKYLARKGFLFKTLQGIPCHLPPEAREEAYVETVHAQPWKSQKKKRVGKNPFQVRYI
jgi:hypothetical protein